MDVLVRFWWYDSIGAHQQRQLREALNRMGAVDLGDLALLPTARRVLLEERDVVLAHALKEAPGPTVVGVVGGAHVDGIQRLWDADTAALLPPALAEPRRPFERYAVGAGALVAVPLAAWRCARRPPRHRRARRRRRRRRRVARLRAAEPCAPL